MSEYRNLLLGCGSNRDKRIEPAEFVAGTVHGPRKKPEWVGVLDTLDLNRPYATYSCDLNLREWYDRNGEPLPSDRYDEIHAYEVLEHLGRQGDYLAFFDHFAEIWRLLKPGGLLAATVPSRFSQWAWGDPGHTRIIPPCALVFLDQTAYQQVGDTSMSDYRGVYTADFRTCYTEDNRESHVFVLQAIKPSRWCAV